MEWLTGLSVLTDRLHEIEQIGFEDVQANHPALLDVVFAVVMDMRARGDIAVDADCCGESPFLVDWKSVRIKTGWGLPIVEGKILPFTLSRELGGGVVFSDLRVESTVKKHSPLQLPRNWPAGACWPQTGTDLPCALFEHVFGVFGPEPRRILGRILHLCGELQWDILGSVVAEVSAA
jgi:hypothetical protein